MENNTATPTSVQTCNFADLFSRRGDAAQAADEDLSSRKFRCSLATIRLLCSAPRTIYSECVLATTWDNGDSSRLNSARRLMLRGDCDISAAIAEYLYWREGLNSDATATWYRQTGRLAEYLKDALALDESDSAGYVPAPSEMLRDVTQIYG